MAKTVKKVLVAGTFSIIHPGHIFLLKEAARLGRVYVVVARDANVQRVKGKRPVTDERQRLTVVRNLKQVYKAVLGDREDFLKPIKKIKPDIILLGPDQLRKEKLEAMLGARGIAAKVKQLKKKYREHPLCSSSRIHQAFKIIET